MEPYRRCVTIGDDHPALPGHFPGHPVVPGVVILDEVAAALDGAGRGGGPAGFLGVKFLRPLSPGESMVIELTPADAGLVAFTCTTDEGEAIAQGRLQLREEA